jgi:hypothetical protein
MNAAFMAIFRRVTSSSPATSRIFENRQNVSGSRKGQEIATNLFIGVLLAFLWSIFVRLDDVVDSHV